MVIEYVERFTRVPITKVGTTVTNGSLGIASPQVVWLGVGL